MVHVHQNGIFHLDLKPANVMLEEVEGNTDPIVQIIDFNSSLRENPEYNTTDITGGTRQYSPRNRNGNIFDDIYGVGAILYHGLTGAPPRLETTTSSSMSLPYAQMAHPSDQPTVSSHRALEQREKTPTDCKFLKVYPADLVAIVRKCLWEPLEGDQAKTGTGADQRYQTMAELDKDLENFQQGLPVTARPLGYVGTSAYWIRRHPVFASVIALLVLLAIGGLWCRDYRNQLEARQQQERDRQEIERGRRTAHERLVLAADEAARRGNWRKALPLYEQALADAQGDELMLCIQRIRGFLATNQRAKASKKLAELAQRQDLGRWKPTVDLLCGDEALCDHSRVTEGKRLVRAALANPSQLSPVDVELATALVSENAVDALRHLENASKIDPFHHRAQCCLLGARLFLGHLDEAVSQAQHLQGVLPDEPLPYYVLAVIAVLREESNPANYLDQIGKHNALESIPNDRKQLLSNADLHLLQKYVTCLGELLTLDDQIQGSDAFDLVTVGRIPLKLRELISLQQKTGDAIAMPLPVGEWLNHLFEQYVYAIGEITIGRTDAALKRVTKARTKHPEAVFLYLEIMIRSRLAVEHRNRNDLESTQRELRPIDELLGQFEAEPTLRPYGFYRYMTRIIAISVDLMWQETLRIKDPTRHARFLPHYHFCIKEGSRYPQFRKKAIETILTGVEYLDPNFAGLVLTEWLYSAPNEEAPLLALAELEM